MIFCSIILNKVDVLALVEIHVKVMHNLINLVQYIYSEVWGILFRLHKPIYIGQLLWNLNRCDS